MFLALGYPLPLLASPLKSISHFGNNVPNFQKPCHRGWRLPLQFMSLTGKPCFFFSQNTNILNFLVRQSIYNILMSSYEKISSCISLQSDSNSKKSCPHMLSWSDGMLVTCKQFCPLVCLHITWFTDESLKFWRA